MSFRFWKKITKVGPQTTALGIEYGSCKYTDVKHWPWIIKDRDKIVILATNLKFLGKPFNLYRTFYFFFDVMYCTKKILYNCFLARNSAEISKRFGFDALTISLGCSTAELKANLTIILAIRKKVSFKWMSLAEGNWSKRKLLY